MMKGINQFLAGALLLTATGIGANAYADDTGAASFYSPSHTSDHAYSSAKYQSVPFDLWDYGYVEREYFMQGAAHVYQYVDDENSDEVEQATNAREYVNRVLVREPADKSKFSGNVVVEIINDQLNSDIPAVWAQARRHFLKNGDIWIGITSLPTGLDALKKYSPDRYQDLTWPVWEDSCKGGNKEEDGAIYDMITSLGRAIRGNSDDPAKNPLAGYNARYLYLTGYSEGALVLQTYNRAIAPDSTLFDGYMPIAGFGRRPINTCTSALSPSATRGTVQSKTAAVMQVQTESEPNLFSSISLGKIKVPQRDDSDASDDRYRYYDVAGATHLDQNLFDQQPQTSDLEKAGGDVFDVDELKSQCYGALSDILPTAKLNTFPDFVPYDAIWQAMEDWVRDGKTPPKADRFNALGALGTPIGGWRSPAVDLPTGLYIAGSPISTVAAFVESALGGTLDERQVCFGAGAFVPFNHRLEAWKGLWPTSEAYRVAYTHNVTEGEKNGFITSYDADYLKSHWKETYNKGSGNSDD